MRLRPRVRPGHFWRQSDGHSWASWTTIADGRKVSGVDRRISRYTFFALGSIGCTPVHAGRRVASTGGGLASSPAMVVRSSWTGGTNAKDSVATAVSATTARVRPSTPNNTATRIVWRERVAFGRLTTSGGVPTVPVSLMLLVPFATIHGADQLHGGPDIAGTWAEYRLATVVVEARQDLRNPR